MNEYCLLLEIVEDSLKIVRVVGSERGCPGQLLEAVEELGIEDECFDNYDIADSVVDLSKDDALVWLCRIQG